MSDLMLRVLGEVAAELRRQESLFPGQDLPDGTDPSYGLMAAAAKAACEFALRTGELSWLNVLEEEFWESCEQTDQAGLRAELVQVAAVAVRWVGAIDRRTLRAAA